MSAPEAVARRAGMLALLATETSFFASFIVVYLFYLGKSATGPQPAAVLSAPLVNTACLIASSVTIACALRALRRGDRGAFNALLLLTILLGAAFLGGTAAEWRRLIVEQGLTIRTNLFGTTFYGLVGFHALHVTIGLVLLCAVALLGIAGHVGPANAEPVEMLSWYWHFVDGVWVVVFTVVYGVGT